MVKLLSLLKEFEPKYVLLLLDLNKVKSIFYVYFPGVSKSLLSCSKDNQTQMAISLNVSNWKFLRLSILNTIKYLNYMRRLWVRDSRQVRCRIRFRFQWDLQGFTRKSLKLKQVNFELRIFSISSISVSWTIMASTNIRFKYCNS